MQFEGEPAPSVKWTRTRSDIEASVAEGESWVSVAAAGDADAGKFMRPLQSYIRLFSNKYNLEVE